MALKPPPTKGPAAPPASPAAAAPSKPAPLKPPPAAAAKPAPAAPGKPVPGAPALKAPPSKPGAPAAKPQGATAAKPGIGGKPAAAKPGGIGKPGAAGKPADAAAQAQVIRRREEAAPETTGEPAGPIEQRAIEILGAKELKEPALFKNFLEKLAPRIALPQMSRAILDAFSSLDITAEKLSGCIHGNAYYEQLFLRHISAVSKRENAPKLEGALILLGMQNSRNMLLALQMQRTVRGVYPEADKDGKLKIVPNELLKFALKAEEAVPKDKYMFAETAYAGGLLFDWLSLAAAEIAEEKKKAQNYIEAQFLHALKTAQIAMEISRSVPDFSFKRYVFGAALVHDVGKIAAALLDPEYFNFVDEIGKKQLSRDLRHFVERRVMGIDHAVLGSMICHHFRIFRPIEKAIFFHHEPYKLKDRNRNLFQLSSLVCLATNIANNFRKTEKMDDPVLALWRGPELKDFRIDMREVMRAVTRVV